jgi:hypothetical protein
VTEKSATAVPTKRRNAMKYICLGYYEPAKHAAMTEDERNAMFDECFEYDDTCAPTGTVLWERLFSLLKPR